MALPNEAAMRKVCIVFIILCPVFCEGFDFTFLPKPAANGGVCGVVQCRENVSVSHQQGQVGEPRVITNLIIHRRSSGHGPQAGDWEQVAAVTSQSPSDHRTVIGLDIRGDLSDTEALLILEVSKPEDCSSTEFSCTAVLVNNGGETTLVKSFVRSKDSPLINRSVKPKVPRDGAISGNHRNDPPTIEPFRFTDEQVMFAMWEKMKSMEVQMEAILTGETRLEDKIENLSDRIHDVQNSVGDKVQLSESRIGDRIDILENRLEDKLSTITNDKSICPGESDTGECSKISDQLASVAQSLQTTEKNLTTVPDEQREAEVQASLATVATTTALESKIDDLTSEISILSDLTNTFAGRLDAFETSYSGRKSFPVGEYFDALGSGKKEWRLAFRGTAFTNVDIYAAYLYGTGIPPEIEPGCKQFNYGLPCSSHYRNRDAMGSWGDIDKVLFAIYAKGEMVKRVVFNGQGSDYVNWFTASRVNVSSWDDLKSQSHNMFSIKGQHNLRRFYINNRYGGCTNDAGWFGAHSVPHASCPYEEKVAFPIFLYAPGNSLIRWPSPNVGHADAIGVYLKYNSA